MARLASLIIWAFALQCIVPAGSVTNCKITVAKEVWALPLDYWQQSVEGRNSRTDTMITVSFTMTFTFWAANSCGDMSLNAFWSHHANGSKRHMWYLYDRRDTRTENRHTVSFKINAKDLPKNFSHNAGSYTVFYLTFAPIYASPVCSSKESCRSPDFSLKFDFPSSIRIERVQQSLDLLGNSSVPSSVLWNKTQVAVWKKNSLGILAFNLNVSDEDVYKQNPNQFEYSAITSLNVTFSVLVQFCSTLDSHQQETVADADALSVERPLGTRSASCQQLDWCAQVNLLNSSEDPNRVLLQFRWNVTELYSAVQELYEQSDLSNRYFALVFVTMEASATSGTVNPLSNSEKLTLAVSLTQVFKRPDDAPSVRFEPVAEDSDQVGNTTVAGMVLRDGTQMTLWKVSSTGDLAVNVNVTDEDVYRSIRNRFELSAITCINVTFTVLVQFFNESHDYVDVTGADSDVLTVERLLGTNSASCQQLDWCAETKLNFTVDNRGLVEYRWKVARLHLAVQELYEDLDLSNPCYARVYVTMEAFATSGLTFPLNSTEKLTLAVLLPQVFERRDDAPSVRFEPVAEDSDEIENTTVAGMVLRDGTQMTLWKVSSTGDLAVNVNVTDEDVYRSNPNRFEFSAITSINVTFRAIVQFCEKLDSNQHVDVADFDADSDAYSETDAVELELNRQSASCQQLAWCAQVNLLNSSEDPNRVLLQYRWNVTELYSAVQELYEQSDLSNRPFALVFVTMEASATSGTSNPLTSSQQVVWAVWLQRLRVAVVGKSAAKSNVKAETPLLIAVVLCVMRAVYEQLVTYH